LPDANSAFPICLGGIERAWLKGEETGFSAIRTIPDLTDFAKRMLFAG